jgi:tetratricopeptide (TPR) repeat protein
LRLLLPLLVVFELRLAPRPLDLDQALSAAELAQTRELHSVEAKALTQVAAYQPWRPGLWERIGVQELTSGQPEKAVNAFAQAEERQDLSTYGRIVYGEAYWQQDEIEAALNIWSPLIQSGQADDSMYQRTVLYWRDSGDRNQLIDVLQSRVAANPDETEQSAYELGILLLPETPEEARKYLRIASRGDSGLTAHIYSIEQALSRAKDEQNIAYGQVLIGQALASAGEWGAAVRTFEFAAQMDPGYAEAWAFLAEARQQTGVDGRDAIAAALAEDPNSVVVRTLAALYWRRSGQPEIGLAYLESLARENPQQGLWQIEIGSTLAELGKYERALLYLRKAVELEPENAEYWRILGRFCVDNHLELRDIGLPAARQALLLAPANPNMLDLMGLVLLQLEDEHGAERFLQRALQMDPAHAAAHLHLGQLYLNRASHPEAIRHLKRAKDASGDSSPEVPIIAARLLARYYPGVQ